MKKIFFYSLIALAMVSVSNISHAQTYTLLEPLPSVEEPGKTIPEITINNYITYVFKFAIALAVLLATIMIIIGGFEYMLSESPFGKGNGKTRIQNAAWGLLAAFASYLILQTIDPRLVQINTSIPPICPDALTTDPNTKNSICSKILTDNFASQLTEDLKKLSRENLATVSDLQKKIDGRQKIIAELDLKNSGKEGLTHEERIELEKLKQENKTDISTQIQTIITASAQGYFRGAMNTLHSPNAFSNESTVGSYLEIEGQLNATTIKSIGDAKNNIENIYKTKTDDPNLNHSDRQRLEFEKKFYINQLTDEQKFVERVGQYLSVRGNLSLEIVQDIKASRIGKEMREVDIPLNKAKINYLSLNEEISSPLLLESIKKDPAILDYLKHIKANPMLANQYKTILQDRVDNMGIAIEKAQTLK